MERFPFELSPATIDWMHKHRELDNQAWALQHDPKQTHREMGKILYKMSGARQEIWCEVLESAAAYFGNGTAEYQAFLADDWFDHILLHMPQDFLDGYVRYKTLGSL